MDIIHIGFPKAGSTWLQQSFFPKLPTVNTILSPVWGNAIKWAADYDFDADQIRIQSSKTYLKDKCNVLTSEAFVGGATSDGGAGVWDRTCQRLNLLFPEAKILIIVRNQASFLKSMYKHEIRMGYGFSFRSFYTRYAEPTGGMKMLDFLAIFNYYREHFKDVKVIPFESLFTPESAAEICDFMGVDIVPDDLTYSKKENRGSLSWSFTITKLLNCHFSTKVQAMDDLFVYPRWRYSWSKKIDRLQQSLGCEGKDVTLIPDDILRDIGNRFAESNTALASLLRIDLGELGYPTTSNLL